MKVDSKGSVQERKLRKGSRGYQGEKQGDEKGEVMEPNWELRMENSAIRAINRGRIQGCQATAEILLHLVARNPFLQKPKTFYFSRSKKSKTLLFFFLFFLSISILLSTIFFVSLS